MNASPPDAAAFQLWRVGRFAEAVPFAEAAVAGARVCLPSHGLLATLLLQLGRAQDADAVVTRAQALGTGVSDAYDALAYVCLGLGQHERANQCYRRAARLSPADPRFAYNLACSERSFGRLSEAEALCDRVIATDPTQYPTYLLRAELRVQSAEANHVAQLEEQMGRTTDTRAQMFLGYALGKELDDMREFDRAFAAFRAAAHARRSRLRYDVAVDERKLERIAAAHFSSRGDPRPGHQDSSRFIFIVGLPRSGTTLVERILGGLAGVRSNGETENFSKSLLAATAAGPGDVFERAAAADPAAVGAAYARRANVTNRGDAIVEKLPLNYLYLGAIRRALPRATLLWVRRTPIDSCFAMYRTLFGAAYPFSYDLRELARYHRAHAALMDYWRGSLGGLHEVSYEALVADPARVGAAMAGACGLEWSDQALAIQCNAAVSLTASASQVRRPIYGTSSGRWRHYERHLSALIEAVG